MQRRKRNSHLSHWTRLGEDETGVQCGGPTTPVSHHDMDGTLGSSAIMDATPVFLGVIDILSEASRAILRCLKTGFQFGRPTIDVSAIGWNYYILSTLKLSGHSATCPKYPSFVLSALSDSSHHFLCLHTSLLILLRWQCPHQILPRQQHPLLILPRQRHLL